MPSLQTNKPMMVPRWARHSLLAAWALAGLAFLLLWRVSVSEHRKELRVQSQRAARSASLCSLVLAEFRNLAADHGRGDPSISRRVRVEQVRYKSDLLGVFAAACRPAGEAGAPRLSIDVSIRDIETLDLERASQEIDVWAAWYVNALSESEQAGWPTHTKAPAEPHIQR